MREIQKNEQIEVVNKDEGCIFIHSPFCGTCHLARKMLESIEVMWDKTAFYEMNAPYFPDFLQHHKIKSVPCLLVIKDGKIQETIYAFHSVPFLHNRLTELLTT